MFEILVTTKIRTTGQRVEARWRMPVCGVAMGE